MPKKLDPKKQQWTEPTLSPKKPTQADMSKDWRVRFTFYDIDTGKWEPVSRKSDINTYTVLILSGTYFQLATVTLNLKRKNNQHWYADASNLPKINNTLFK